MQWCLSCTKDNGELRRQFLLWQVPKVVRESLRVVDGDQCYIEVWLDEFRFEGVVRLTSGMEFRLPNKIGNKLSSLAKNASLSLISFSLVPLFLNTLDQELQYRTEEAQKLPSSDKKKLLAKSPKYPQQINVTTTFFLRSQYVIAAVLQRANGICEGCRIKAPFLRASDNTPYLEVHHQKRLADGGEDTPKNAIALCPNCHRKAHFG